MNIAIQASRVLLAALFLYAGAVKAGASEGFAITIAQFSILPPPLVMIFARVLPWLEIAAGILLLIPRTARFGAALTACLLLVFSGAIGWALSQGLIVDCGCFGEDVPPSRERMVATLLRDLLLLGLTVGVASRRLRSSQPCTPGSTRRTPGNGGDS